MKRSTRVRISGPLATHREGFARDLKTQGYKDASVADHLRVVAHLSRWMAPRAITERQLTPNVMAQFVAEERVRHHSFPRSTKALLPLLRYLRSLDLTPPEEAPEVPSNELLRAYDRYLVEERGVKHERHFICMKAARDFLEGRDVAQLRSADVTTFVSKICEQPNLIGRLSGLRSVLRFLFLQGHTAVNLVPAVPPVSRRRLVSLPQAIDEAQIDALLSTCDRRTTLGRRNYVALLLMVRLGLRAGEVASVTLDDLEWDVGEVVIRGKRSTGRLPLPADVGAAIVSYLRRRRRQSTSRSLLLQIRAPYRDASTGMVIGIASRALRAVGITSGGAHRLRHTAATQMLRRGASMTEIAQVLRHRRIDTTAIYAKVDHDDLRTLARPWPSGRSGHSNELREMALPWPGGSA